MTISEQTEAEIRRLFFAEHWKRGTIATQLGQHFDTVTRAIGPLGPRRGERCQPISCVLSPYIEFIHQTLGCYPRLRSKRLYDRRSEERL